MGLGFLGLGFLALGFGFFWGLRGFGHSGALECLRMQGLGGLEGCEASDTVGALGVGVVLGCEGLRKFMAFPALNP